MGFTGVRAIPRGSVIDADICIVGGGPAGITVALTIARSRPGLRLVLLESGEREGPGDAQRLNEGIVVGQPYYALDETRFRGLGGNSHRWAGWCRPLDALTFETRPFQPTSGWPITRRNLDPYYAAALALCELPGADFTVSDDLDLPTLYRRPFVDGDVEVAMWHGSPPTKFGAVYGAELDAAPNVTVVTEATATSVTTDDASGRATGVTVASLDGNRFSVTARAVVLCAGAMESTRLLLVSKPGGLGNEHDLVGRHFMEHPHLVTGIVDVFESDRRPTGVPALDLGVKGARARLALQRPAGSIKLAYVLSEAVRRREELMAFSTHFQTVSPVPRDSEGYQAMRLVLSNLRSPKRLAAQIRSGEVPVGVATLAGRILKDLPDVSKALYHEAMRRPRQLALYTQAEQTANPQSRITLDRARTDTLGVPRIRLDWRLSEVDKRSIIRSQELIGKHLENVGVGRLEPTEPFRSLDDDWGAELRGGHHHLGTARMADDPRKGVVDADLRVHTVRDLYVGDSAVFPTAGFANPMLTTVALAARLGDHLVGQYS